MTSHIAAAAPLDPNADGMLDLLLSVKSQPRFHVGKNLLGNGMGGLQPATTLLDLDPDMLDMDGDNNLVPDIMFTSADGSLAFCKNDPPRTFEIERWNPYQDDVSEPSLAQNQESSAPTLELELAKKYGKCLPEAGFGSHAFVDMKGDCLPNLVITVQTLWNACLAE